MTEDAPDDRGLSVRLRQAIALRGISQGALEKAAGLPDAYVTKLLQRKRPNIGFQTLEDIARALDVDYAWLATGEGDIAPRTTTAGTTVREYESRYPNFDLAAEVARREGLPSDAIERVRATALSSEDDPPPMHWFKRIEVAADDIRREGLSLKLDVDRHARKREADRAHVVEKEQVSKPKLPKRRGA